MNWLSSKLAICSCAEYSVVTIGLDSMMIMINA